MQKKEKYLLQVMYYLVVPSEEQIFLGNFHDLIDNIKQKITYFAR